MYVTPEVQRRVEITDKQLLMFKDEEKSVLDYAFNFSDTRETQSLPKVRFSLQFSTYL